MTATVPAAIRPFRQENPRPRWRDPAGFLILGFTFWYWPEIPALGMVTFIDCDKVRHKRDYGRCYLRAGFEPDGETEGGLLAFRMRPENMPEPLEPVGFRGQFGFRFGFEGQE